MKIKTAIVVTCISAILLFAPINLSLVLTTNHFCIVVCQIPFTNRVLQLPYWTWTASLLLVPVCILAILLSGVLVVVRLRRERKATQVAAISALNSE
jgi:hypothetical protein